MAAGITIGEGRIVNVAAPGAITAGDVYEGADSIGLYLEDAASGAIVSLLLLGEVELDKETPLVIALGDKVYWDAANDRIDKTNTNIPAGICSQAAASADTRVRVLLTAPGA